MDQKPHCQDVAEAIINYLRNECAVSTSAGVELTSYTLANIVGCSQSHAASQLRRLVDFRIITLKSGIYERGNNGPKFFALGEGYEEGDEWRKIYYGDKQPITPQKSKGVIKPILPSEIVRQKVESDKYVELLKEHIALLARFEELQQRYNEVLLERNKAQDTVKKLNITIEEMRDDLRTEAEAAHQSQETVTQLELQLRQARSQIASNERRIAKNEGQSQVAFAHR